MTSLSREDFLRNLSESGLLSLEETDAALRALSESQAMDGETIAQRLIEAGKLTSFQATAVGQRQFQQLVIGNYQVLDRLGAGGMGTVYKARHRRMKRIVAIKVLSRAAGQNEAFLQRFQREVEVVARLSHPNIVLAHDADESELGHFLVMEFVDGCDLATAVQVNGPLPISEVVACILQAARAMDYAHSQGIIHRDIKPANLLRDVNGVVKVADLGLARFNSTFDRSTEETSALTQAGAIMGTVDYMAPEQALGLADVGHRVDIYSLGCTLYFLLMGRPPYQGPTLMATLMQHREGAIPSMRQLRAEVPSTLDRIFQQMVAKKPNDRFATMGEVVGAIEVLTLSSELTQRRSTQPVDPNLTMIFPAAQDTRGAEAGDRRRPVGKQVASKTILLVEPSRSQAVIIRGYLQKLGYEEVLTAASGEKALETTRSVPPGVVVSAMHLPDMTGVQLAEHLRSVDALRTIGFVLITSQADAVDATALSQIAGVVRLPKPFEREQLAHALSRANDESTEVTSAGPAHQASSGTAGRLRVLLVDDSAAARIHVRDVLKGLGVLQITEAADGMAAVDLLGGQIYDLVVTDYNMPRLDGAGLIDFIRHRSRTPSVPVIVVTTETDPSKLEALRCLGVSAICDKLFQPETVRSVLQNLE